MGRKDAVSVCANTQRAITLKQNAGKKPEFVAVEKDEIKPVVWNYDQYKMICDKWDRLVFPK
jgi:hypothetical protein